MSLDKLNVLASKPLTLDEKMALLAADKAEHKKEPKKEHHAEKKEHKGEKHAHKGKSENPKTKLFDDLMKSKEVTEILKKFPKLNIMIVDKDDKGDKVESSDKHEGLSKEHEELKHHYAKATKPEATEEHKKTFRKKSGELLHKVRNAQVGASHSEKLNSIAKSIRHMDTTVK